MKQIEKVYETYDEHYVRTVMLYTNAISTNGIGEIHVKPIADQSAATKLNTSDAVKLLTSPILLLTTIADETYYVKNPTIITDADGVPVYFGWTLPVYSSGENPELEAVAFRGTIAEG